MTSSSPVVEFAHLIDEQMHEAFAALTGDVNPLHVDPLAARRLPFGRRAVHGIHLVALSLVDLAHVLAERRSGPDGSSVNALDIERVRATFRHPVPVGAEVSVVVTPSAHDERTWGLAVDVDVWRAVDIVVDVGPPATTPPMSPETSGWFDPWPADAQPLDRRLDDLEGAQGSVAHVLPPASLWASIGPAAAADVLTVTRLVGMVAPGLHSLLSSIDLSFDFDNDTERNTEPGAGHGSFRYRVDAVDERFSRVRLAVGSSSMRGEVVAFVRPAPVRQHAGDWTVRPEPGEFDDHVALVIGGSRGLGAMCAQLLAAGGASVTVTYRAGADDADDVVAAIRAAGGTADSLQLDVTDLTTVEHAIGRAGRGWTHLYYFATPPIFQGVAGAYSDTLAADFEAVYGRGCERVIGALDEGSLVGVMMPSTVALDAPAAGLAEYIDAKRAAEEMVEAEARRRGLLVSMPRLPRLATDQTASVVPVETGDTADELLRAIRSFRRPSPPR